MELAQSAHHTCALPPYGHPMLAVTKFVVDMTTEVGLIAAAIAVGGFIGQAKSTLKGDGDARLRRTTVIGGLSGIAFVAFVNLAGLYFS